uniref:Uncharacterized protein n=1 Tax=Rhodnius prolixus TaxID=13249 RepID=T1I460_RHOPR
MSNYNFEGKCDKTRADKKNVALICLKSDMPEDYIIHYSECSQIKENAAGWVMKVVNRSISSTKDEEDKYKKDFRKYKNDSQFYDKRILNVVTRISETILQRTVDSVLEEMDISKYLLCDLIMEEDVLKKEKN